MNIATAVVIAMTMCCYDNHNDACYHDNKNHWLLLLQIGCGAIGCEMMKNYAMLGVATSEKGKV